MSLTSDLGICSCPAHLVSPIDTAYVYRCQAAAAAARQLLLVGGAIVHRKRRGHLSGSQGGVNLYSQLYAGQRIGWFGTGCQQLLLLLLLHELVEHLQARASA